MVTSTRIVQRYVRWVELNHARKGGRRVRRLMQQVMTVLVETSLLSRAASPSVGVHVSDWVKLRGEEDKEDEQWHDDERVGEGRVKARPALFRRHFRRTEKNNGKDECVEDANDGETEENPQRDKNDYPAPGDPFWEVVL